MPSVLDVVKGDGFSVVDMTQAINRLPHKPARLGELGLFEVESVSTTSVMFDLVNGVLTLIPNGRREGPGTPMGSDKARSVMVPLGHLKVDRSVMADDVQGIREIGGTSDQRQTIAKKLNDKMAEARVSFEATWEHQRAGAIQGQVWDHDGTNLLPSPATNLYDVFGVAKPAAVDFVLGTAATDVRDKAIAVKESIESKLGGVPFLGIRAICGSRFFRKFIGHAEVKNAYKDFTNNEFLRSDPRFSGFQFAEIFWESYRGQVGKRSFVDPDRVRFLPFGVPGMYKTYFGPANYVETVNTMGQPLYAKQVVMEFDTGIKVQMQSNPLSICTRPDALGEGYSSN